MKIWLPYIAAGGGADIFTERFSVALGAAGHEVVCSAFPRRYLAAPHLLKRIAAPPETDIIVAHSWWAFAFKRKDIPLVLIEHGLVLDSDYAPYRSWSQAISHRVLLYRYIRSGLRLADSVVAVSNYTARSLEKVYRFSASTVILNGMDTAFFSPLDRETADVDAHRQFRLLFVGHLIRRKGADLLPAIMRSLGNGYELRYTSGWRQNIDLTDMSNMTPLGLLDQATLRDEYRSADLLLFPTRFDGFGLPVIESMACGTPVIGSNCCALPELVEHGINGRLCTPESIEEYADSIRELKEDRPLLMKMAASAREVALRRFGEREMLAAYIELFENLRKKRAVRG
jgi:glycosyltransferase involved in cell wall biosynthesis